ncbi:PepSY domain-containing protein [Caulobacter sp. RHG1]|uniref:PepSY domain-containing protein n=1 Tax=Caulobacter sp. (strain RHG1) TaxID=2545762 RepID=UPI0015561702|nr:PepSY domain-containing protein [Caulobacter sp. RHG1]NQE60396.1 hypothetical protein [Caulobacter sp. RHG1]
MNRPLILTSSAAIAAVLALAPLAFADAPKTKITQVAPKDLPAAVVKVVKAAAPTMTIKEAELKEREDRRYYDVEGTMPDGSEIEFDLLEKNGGWEIVETQRDIAWASAPKPVRDAAAASGKKITPVRVIESAQNDGMVIYELFAAGKPEEPSMEVSLKDGQVKVLEEVWPH